MRVRRFAHVGGAELEDHGGAQEAQETDPGNITELIQITPLEVKGHRIKAVSLFRSVWVPFVTGSIFVGSR